VLFLGDVSVWLVAVCACAVFVCVRCEVIGVSCVVVVTKEVRHTYVFMQFYAWCVRLV
jgi:hypothetical protein